MMKNMLSAKSLFPHRAFFLSCLLVASGSLARAESAHPTLALQTITSQHSYDDLLQRLERAISDNKMGLVAQASASKGAAARGVKIPGNTVLMVFRNDYAVRLLETNLLSGIEAPLRLYVTENRDGTASVTYRTPSATFAPYGSSKLDALASELDPILKKIVTDATGK